MSIADLWEQVAPEHFQKERFQLLFGDDEYWRVWDAQEDKYLTPPLVEEQARPLVKIIEKANQVGMLNPAKLERTAKQLAQANY